ncbi:MAG: helix-turn-helix domain-containing protein [Prevotella sp.]|nr:helix-turn-helix domain-containing protein [Prevotella sp.]
MEFNEKLQELRKQKGLTQEELSEILYVSRTAISKWESGRGYPNIDSLKAISKYFSVSLDELLSCDAILTIAEEENTQKEMHFRNLVFGLLDCSVAIFLFLPFFGQRVDGVIQEVSLLSLTEMETYIKIPYFMAGRKILCKRFSTKSRMVLESRADSGLNPLITESHGGQNGMRAGTA